MWCCLGPSLASVLVRHWRCVAPAVGLGALCAVLKGVFAVQLGGSVAAGSPMTASSCIYGVSTIKWKDNVAWAISTTHEQASMHNLHAVQHCLCPESAQNVP
jgi:hypothetical protein